MTTVIDTQRADIGTPTTVPGTELRLTSKQVWDAIAKASFAVVSYVTPRGEPRSSGVMYRVMRRRLFVAVGTESWKARHVSTGQRVSVTVTVPRGGILSLVLPIPPATVSFSARALMHPPGSADVTPIMKELAAILPEDRQKEACLMELAPEGFFLVYGVGVPLLRMRDPDRSRARVPVAERPLSVRNPPVVLNRLVAPILGGPYGERGQWRPVAKQRKTSRAA